MFNPKQVKALDEPLDSKRVKSREQGGFNVSYIEGWWAIQEANRIFGFGNWEQKITDLKKVSEDETKKGIPRIGYIAQVEITVWDPDSKTRVTREDVGFGSGMNWDPGVAHEGAVKEAVTDAMKRALRTFGNQFGLALYDKDQTNVENSALREEAKHYMEMAVEAIELAKDTEALKKWWNGEKIQRQKAGLTQEDVDELKTAVQERLAMFEEG